MNFWMVMLFFNINNIGWREDLGENKFIFGFDEFEMFMRYCFELKRLICFGYVNMWF